MVSAKYKSLFWSCAVIFGLLPPVAVAGPAEDAAVVGPVEEAVVDPAEVFARAEQAMSRADVKEALWLLRKAAEQNYIPAQVFFGEYLDYSEYDDEAVGWFMTAAYQGNAAGAFGLAKMYGAGEGVEKNEEKALYWFRFAAERNHLAAVRMMHAAYKKGILGQKIDLEQAKFWEDKLPALEAFEKREYSRKEKIAKKAAEEEEEKRKAEQAEITKRFLETKAIEAAAAKKTAEGTAQGESGQGLAK